MQSLLSELIDSLVRMPSEFAAVAAQGPIEALLVLLGALIVIGSSGVLGYLALGALVDLITPDVSGRAPPRAGR